MSNNAKFFGIDPNTLQKPKGISFDQYLMELTKLIKAEPDNIFKSSNESFAKAIDEAFRASVAETQEELRKKITGIDDDDLNAYVNNTITPERRKALDAGLNTERRKALDAYSNNALLLGQADTFSSFDSYDFNTMIYAWPLWTSLYTSSWVFQKIIDITGSDLIKNGWKINVQPERKYQFIRKDNKLYRQDITPEFDMSKVYRRQSKAISYVVDAVKWMLMYGGSAVCLMDNTVEDTNEYREELKDFKGKKNVRLNYLVVDRWQGVIPSAEKVTDDESPDFGQPKYYTVRTEDGGGSYVFHHTRVARFVNGELPRFLKTMMMGWGLPIGTRIFNEINRDERIKNMITSLLSKYNLEIVQTAGMKQYMHGELTPEMESQLDYKLSMINRYRHFNSMMFLDKDDQYQRLDGNVGGLYQLFDSNTRAVTGAASMPAVKLYGDQSQGLSGSSFDDLRLWEDHLDAERNSKLRRPIEKITWWHLLAEGIKDDFSIKFNSSLPKTMDEKINETRSVLDMYNQLISMGLYDIEMVRNELKERDDLLLGNQLQMTSVEDLEEIEEEVAEGFNDDFDDFGGSGGGDYGDENFDEPADMSDLAPELGPSEPVGGDAPIDMTDEPTE